MKNRTIPFSALLIGILSLVGCKTASQLAWWKSNDAAETTVLANAEPELPSDAAKRVELASNAESPAGGGQAAPFVPEESTETSTADIDPGSFPSTGVAPYSPENAIAAISSNTSNASSSTAAGSAEPGIELSNQALPYNPSAVPSGSAGASLAVNEAPASRYGGASAPTTNYGAAPAYNQATQTAATGRSAAPFAASTGSAGMSSDDYGADHNALETSLPNAIAINDGYDAGGVGQQPTATNSSLSVGTPAAGRYGDAGMTASATAPNDYSTPTASAEQSSATNSVASAAYRPGGTTSYPTAELAARPFDATSPNAAGDAPNISSPTTTTLDGATRYR